MAAGNDSHQKPTSSHPDSSSTTLPPLTPPTIQSSHPDAPSDFQTPPSPAPSATSLFSSTSLLMQQQTQKKKYKMATECVYVEPIGNVRDPYNAASMPIYQTATFKQHTATSEGEYDYSRSGNPTRSHLELHLAKLMSAQRALAVSSGMGCLDIITRLVPTSHEIIAGDDIYGGTQRLLTFLSTHNNIKVHHVDTTNPEAVRSVLNEKTRLVLLETPTNPLLRVVDVRGVARVVREVCGEGKAGKGCLVVVDNTMMSPYLQRPLEFGADIVYDSGTKYLSGHHDLMAGVVGCKDEAVGDKLYSIINATGCALPPFDSFLLMRGIKTLSVRMDRQQQNALLIATRLHSLSFRVNYPGLPSHPSHALHSSHSSGPGAVLSFTTGSVEKSERVVEGTRLWGIS
ncbi:cystathionine beta-lyase, partial [Rhizophlyctis rosea]